MHLVAAHAEHHLPTLLNFLRRNPLGLLITSIDSAKEARLQASHIPWVVHESKQDDKLPLLRGHIARANPQAKSIIEHCQAQPDQSSSTTKIDDEVLIMFNGPAHGYVSPRFYLETKPKTGRTVPTWDYTAVQAYGFATIFHDKMAPETVSYLKSHLTALSSMTESELMGYSEPWKVEDAPRSYTDQLVRGIIGIEVEVTRLEGRFKLSQDKPAADREGVAVGFAELGTEAGDVLAAEVRAQAKIHDDRKAARTAAAGSN